MITDPTDMSKTTALDSLATSPDVIIITPGAGALSKKVRGLRCEGAGTVTVTTFAGNSVTLNFKDGETRYVGCTHVTAKSGPTVIEGLV